MTIKNKRKNQAKMSREVPSYRNWINTKDLEAFKQFKEEREEKLWKIMTTHK